MFHWHYPPPSRVNCEETWRKLDQQVFKIGMDLLPHAPRRPFLLFLSLCCHDAPLRRRIDSNFLFAILDDVREKRHGEIPLATSIDQSLQCLAHQSLIHGPAPG